MNQKIVVLAAPVLIHEVEHRAEIGGEVPVLFPEPATSIDRRNSRELRLDCRQLMNISLNYYDTFIDDFAEFLNHIPETLRYVCATVVAALISQHMSMTTDG